MRGNAEKLDYSVIGSISIQPPLDVFMHDLAFASMVLALA